MKARSVAAAGRPESPEARRIMTLVVLILMILLVAAVYSVGRPVGRRPPAALSSSSSATDNAAGGEIERKTVLLLTEGLHGRCAESVMMTMDPGPRGDSWPPLPSPGGRLIWTVMLTYCRARAARG